MADYRDSDLRVSDSCFVPLDDFGFDNRVSCAVRQQYRCANLRQNVVVVDRVEDPPTRRAFRFKTGTAQLSADCKLLT